MSWRLEPTPRAEGIDEGLAARIHDPLWLLARQWQMGEFRGQDAGTPALVQVAGSNAPITAWRGPQQPAWASFDPNQSPLDELVEPEDESSPDLRERIEAGACFQRLLAAAGLARYASAFLEAHPFDAATLSDPAFDADSLLAAVARRQPDGLALHVTATALVAGQAIAVSIDAPDGSAVTAVATEWLAWYAAEIDPLPGSGTAVTWQEHRMEYAFAVSSPAAGGIVLKSESYLGDGLDWFDFDIDPLATASTGGAATPISARAVPTPVSYGGMPLPRFWAMEDARYDFGSVDAAANDIGRMLLVEFATVYGNDWYILPLKLPVGSLTILDTVVVSDVFGRNLLIERAGIGEPQWNLFSLSTTGVAHAVQDALLLPPTVGYSMESTPVETVLFLRDEMADLAWGVEALVEDNLERRIDRRSIWAGHRTLPAGDPARPSYLVETVVPDHWIPLAPEQLADQQSVRLRLVPMEADQGGTPVAIEPRGRLLNANDSDGHLWLFEEEVPREGTLVNRLYRYARWQGGRSALWTARRRGTGRGEGSSGLKFDVLNPSGS
jgi:hypothetical protein